jgi:hypothetical protein
VEQLDLFTKRLPARPYCADDFAFGLLIRPKAAAVQCRYIQPNSPFPLGWLVFDIDHPDAAVRWEGTFIPPPSIIVVNGANGHAHLLYAIKTPVFSTPNHPRPLRLAAAVQEGMREKLDGDPGYSGLIVKNPLHSDWRVIVWKVVYELDELACRVDLDKPKKRPRREELGLGRNCSLFDRLRHWAYRQIAAYKGAANAAEWDRAVLAQAAELNDFNLPLHESEVRAIAKSTAKWCWGRFDIQASNERFSRLQAHRGRKSGIARLAKNEDKRAAARLMKAQGQNTRAIAATLGVDQSTVSRWVQ